MGDHDQSTLKHNEHLLLDQPLLRLPSELLRKNFRSAHFTIEKDTSALKTLLKDSATAAVSGKANQDDVLKNLDAMIAKMRGVKRKLNSHAEEESRLHTQAAARIAHLDELYSMNTVEDVRYEAWSRQRLDRLLTDYLLRHGFNESARQLAEERGMQNLTDVDTFVAMSRIRDSLLNGSVTEALAWCNENKKELRKMESKLEFMLRLQQYIEIIRNSKVSRNPDALSHSKKYIIPYWHTYPKEASQACGLLAFPPESPACGVYANLYRQSRWNDLAELFTETHHTLLSLPSAPLIHVALSSGLSALKTPACHHSSSRDAKSPPPSTFGHGVCPICSVELNDLARNVPYAHHTKSHVEHDLLLLPNGRVYGKSRLDEQTKKAGLPWNLVKDPQTGDVFAADDVKKVYIS